MSQERKHMSMILHNAFSKRVCVTKKKEISLITYLYKLCNIKKSLILVKQYLNYV